MSVVSVKLIDTQYDVLSDHAEGVKRYQVIYSGGVSGEDALSAQTAIDPVTSLTPAVVTDEWSATVSGSICYEVHATQDGRDGQSFTVECKFTTTPPTGISNDPDPTNEPARVDWDFQTSQEPVTKDRDDEPILNSALTAFDPEMEDVVYDLVAVITRNVATFDPTQAQAYIDHTNSDVFAIQGYDVPIDTALCIGFKGTPATKNGIDYYVQQITIALRADGWARNRLNEGRMQLVYVAGDGDTPQNILEDDGTKIAEPRLLDADGHVTLTPLYLSFNIKQQAAFADLALP